MIYLYFDIFISGRLRDASDRHVDSKAFLEDVNEVEEEVEEDSDTESINNEETVKGANHENVISIFIFYFHSLSCKCQHNC